MSEDEIHDKLTNPPPRKLITDGDGRFIKVMELSDVLTPQHRRCKTCAARFRCSRAQKDGKDFADVDCVIEKDVLDELLIKLTLEGVTTQDELLVFPLVRNVFQLVRLYELESVQDLSRVLRDEEAMKTYKEINSMINKSETQVIKFLKELLATRKEDHKKTVVTVKNATKKFDLAKKLGAKKKDASEVETISEGETEDYS